MFGSGGVPESVTVAVLEYDPEVAAVTVTVTVAVAPLFRGDGRVQLIGPAPTHVVPALGTTETSVGPAASVSVSVVPSAADGPLFFTVMVYTEFWPRNTALPTVVLTPRSAVVGLIETAPSDQLELPLNVSEIGTLGAPVRLLPTPRTSGLVLFPDLKFHCAT